MILFLLSLDHAFVFSFQFVKIYCRVIIIWVLCIRPASLAIFFLELEHSLSYHGFLLKCFRIFDTLISLFIATSWKASFKSVTMAFASTIFHMFSNMGLLSSHFNSSMNLLEASLVQYNLLTWGYISFSPKSSLVANAVLKLCAVGDGPISKAYTYLFLVIKHQGIGFEM